MIAFERGKDPREGLDIGAKKEAIKISGIGYSIDSEDKKIVNPMKAKIFLDRLKSGDLPKDPIFGGIEIIFAWHEEFYLRQDYNSSISASLFERETNKGWKPKSYIRQIKTKNYNLNEIAGKTLDMCGKLMLFPTFEELEKAGFSYIKDIDEGVEMVNQESERIDKKLSMEEQELIQKEYKKHEDEFESQKKNMEKIHKMAKSALNGPEENWETYKRTFLERAKNGFDVFKNGHRL